MKYKGLLFSGGTESTLLMNKLLSENFDVYALYVKSGYLWEETEIKYAKRIIEFYEDKYPHRKIKFHIIDLTKTYPVKQLGYVKNKQDNIIPLRNLTLVTLAAGVLLYNNIKDLYIGAVYISGYPDLSKEYFKKLENLIRKGSNFKEFNILLPFFYMDKSEILKKYSENAPLHLIFSCTNPVNDERCGKCYKCTSLEETLEETLF